MTVEATKPHITWKPPLTEIFAMSAALLILLVPFQCFVKVMIYMILWNVVFIGFG
jgi:hypothetical protein